MTFDVRLTRTASRPPRHASGERPVFGTRPRAVREEYGRGVAGRPALTPSRAAESRTVEAVRLAVAGPGTLPATRGLLLSDEIHRLVVRELDGGRAEVIGHAGAPSNHTHAHWVSVTTAELVTGLLIWVPAGLSTSEVAAVLAVALRGVGGRRSRRPIGNGADSLPALDLLLESAGPVTTVAPEMCGPARVWRSRMPYLPVRHRKRAESLADHLLQDVRRELAYRDQPPAAVQRLGREDDLVDQWAAAFQRHRAKEHHNHRRPAYGLRLEFGEPVQGPLLLGQLSHFGFGTFAPERDDDE
jgi:CRISPR-associated protein Csb2